MAETQQSSPDSSGVMRTPTGDIASPPLTSTQDSKGLQPEPKQSTTPPTDSTKETKSDVSLINEPDKPEGDKPADKADGKQAAPEKYADFKVPEGFTLDSELLGEATTTFREAGLSQDQAQKFMDLYAKSTKEAMDAPYETYRETRKVWREEIQADPEIGGRMGEVKASIGRLIDSFGNAKVAAGFRNAMNLTGAGDNPDVVRGLYALSKLVTEGKPVQGNGPSVEGQRAPGTSARPSAAQAIYPHLPSSQTG